MTKMRINDKNVFLRYLSQQRYKGENENGVPQQNSAQFFRDCCSKYQGVFRTKVPDSVFGIPEAMIFFCG